MTARDEQIAWCNQRPVLVRCANCDWTHEGTLEDGREAHARHRRKHGAEPKRRHRRAGKPFSVHAGLDENIQNARQQGAATWAGPV